MLKPMGARALVTRLEAPRMSSSNIIIPETVEAKPSQFALVLAVGKLREGGFDVGDTVILKDFVGAPCRVNLYEDTTVDAHIVNEDDVIAVVEGL